MRHSTAFVWSAVASALTVATSTTAIAAPIGVFVYTQVYEITDSTGGSALIDLCYHGTAPQVPADSCSGAYASAYGNMNTGTLTGSDTVPSNEFGGGDGGATVQINDALKFNGASPGQHITIAMTGGGSDSSGNGFALLGLGLTFGSPGDNSTYPSADVFGQSSTSGDTNGCSTPDGFPDVTVCTKSGGALEVSIDFPVDLVDPSRGVYAIFYAGCFDHKAGTCTVSDPITVNMPAGVSFTSASGQFLTAPIPAAAWLFASALAPLAWLRRRG